MNNVKCELSIARGITGQEVLPSQSDNNASTGF